jgi:hypothetical protein
MSFFVQASRALNDVISYKLIEPATEIEYSGSLQKLYIRYIRMTSSVKESLILGPRAFFIYLVQGKKPQYQYTGETLEGKLKELVRNAQILDTHPAEYQGGNHLVVMKIFSRGI